MEPKDLKPKKNALEMGTVPHGRHILIVESPESRRAVALNIAPYSVGRHPNNSLVLSSKMISRHHATFLWLKSSETDEYSFWIADGTISGQRSRNGVYINGKKCLLHKLKHGDMIKLGSDIKIRYNLLSSSSEHQNLSPSQEEEPTLQTSKLRSVDYRVQTLIEPEE